MSLEFMMFVAFAVIVGSLCGAIAFIPAIRKNAKLKKVARQRLFIILGIVAFALIFLGGSWVQSQFHSNVVACQSFGNSIDCNLIGGVENELWLRQMVPPPLRNVCLGGDNENCRIINQYDIVTEGEWSTYAMLWFGSALAAFVAVLIAERVTRQ